MLMRRCDDQLSAFERIQYQAKKQEISNTLLEWFAGSCSALILQVIRPSSAKTCASAVQCLLFHVVPSISYGGQSRQAQLKMRPKWRLPPCDPRSHRHPRSVPGSGTGLDNPERRNIRNLPTNEIRSPGIGQSASNGWITPPKYVCSWPLRHALRDMDQCRTLRDRLSRSTRKSYSRAL